MGTSDTNITVDGVEIDLENVDFGTDGQPHTVTLDDGTKLALWGTEPILGEGTADTLAELSEAKDPIETFDNSTSRRLAEWCLSPDHSQGQLASQCIIVLSGVLLLALFYSMFKILKQRRRMPYPKPQCTD